MLLVRKGFQQFLQTLVFKFGRYAQSGQFVGLGDDDDREYAGIVRDREVAFEASYIEIPVRRRDDEERVHVGRNQLELPGRACSAPLE